MLLILFFHVQPIWRGGKGEKKKQGRDWSESKIAPKMTGNKSLKMGANSKHLIVGLGVEFITYYSHVTKNCINRTGR